MNYLQRLGNQRPSKIVLQCDQAKMPKAIYRKLLTFQVSQWHHRLHGTRQPYRQNLVKIKIVVVLNWFFFCLSIVECPSYQWQTIMQTWVPLKVDSWVDLNRMVFDLSHELIEINIFKSCLSHELNRISSWKGAWVMNAITLFLGKLLESIVKKHYYDRISRLLE